MPHAAAPPASSVPWAAIGFWLAVAIAALQAVNAVRAFVAPAGFASYLGLPLTDPQDQGFVLVYGLRAAFIALAVGGLLATRNYSALAWVALVGLVMPIGDAILVARAGAPVATIARHIAIGVFLAVTAGVLWFAARPPAGT